MTFKTTKSNPPKAEKKPTSSTHHGITKTDDYGWLRAENWQEVMRDPTVLAGDIRQYLEAENTYQDAMMADTVKLQEELFGEMRGRIKEDDSSVPMRDGAWKYGVSFVEGGEHPKYFRMRIDHDDRSILLDGDELANGHEYFNLGGASHSPDHKLLSWSYDDKGSEYYCLRFRDMAAGDDMDDLIVDSNGGGVWSKNSDQFIYGRLDENHRPSKLFVHEIGQTTDVDKLIYEENDPGFFMGAGKTQSGDWIIVDIHDHQTSEAWVLPADKPDGDLKLIAQRETGIEYSIDESGGTFYILTNRDGAKDFKIVTAPVVRPGKDKWVDLIAHQEGRLILSHGVFARHLIWLEREAGLPRIVIHRISDGAQHAIRFDEDAYSLGLGGSYEFDTDIIRFTYSSMTTPSQTFEYNMETRERTLLKTQEVPSGHKISDYVTRRIEAPAADGELVPVSLLYHCDTPLDGSAPCLLYGYGSYGMSIPASFNTNCLSLVNRGFIYAIAHIRGGKDKGFAWYEAGKKEHKTNTFSDFISAGEYLCEKGYTAHGNIIAHGGSAGGMLMGAISNLKPELFSGIIAEVPFVDVLNTMLDDTLPLTPPEWPEWGNPLADKSDYEYIAAYSPYDQIARQSYPPILAIGGLTDPRVTYWEPAKWVAKLREYAQGDAPILLKTNMDSGHGGASGRFQRLTEVAFNYAFALKCAGIAK